MDKFLYIAEIEIKTTKILIKKHGKHLGFRKADAKYKFPEGTMRLYFERHSLDSETKGTHQKMMDIIDEFNQRPGDVN